MRRIVGNIRLLVNRVLASSGCVEKRGKQNDNTVLRMTVKFLNLLPSRMHRRFRGTLGSTRSPKTNSWLRLCTSGTKNSTILCPDTAVFIFYSAIALVLPISTVVSGVV